MVGLTVLGPASSGSKEFFSQCTVYRAEKEKWANWTVEQDRHKGISIADQPAQFNGLLKIFALHFKMIEKSITVHEYPAHQGLSERTRLKGDSIYRLVVGLVLELVDRRSQP